MYFSVKEALLAFSDFLLLLPLLLNQLADKWFSSGVYQALEMKKWTQARKFGCHLYPAQDLPSYMKEWGDALEEEQSSVAVFWGLRLQSDPGDRVHRSDHGDYLPRQDRARLPAADSRPAVQDRKAARSDQPQHVNLPQRE